jgi:general secretion pathway protein J
MMHAQRTIPASCPTGPMAGIGAFTLVEVLLAIAILGMVMVAVHSVFHAALQLRNKADEAFTEAIPLQHALATIKNDLINIALPGGTLSGSLQTSPTTDSSMSLTHDGEQCGPTFYTTTGTLSDLQPWSEMRKVTYYLMQPTNDSNGLDLVRSVTRNLLPVNEEEYSDQRLMSGVNQLTFQFYDGTSWQDDWDSTGASSSTTTTSTNPLPTGVRVQLTLINKAGVIDRNPIEMVIPVTVNGQTNTTSTGGEE